MITLSKSLFAKHLLMLLTFGLLCIFTTQTNAQNSDDFQQISSKGIEFIKSVQREDGTFTEFPAPGINTLVTTALLRHGISKKDPMVKKALANVTKHIKSDGGIYHKDSIHRNYETSLALMCIVEANKDGEFNKVIKNADKFLKGLQWDEGENKTPEDYDYGGAGYGKHKRPDMSNTTFLIEALRAAGNSPDDPNIQAALKFISRAQNLESEHNTTPFSAKINDGSFYYTPAAGGSSQAGEGINGGLRGYGSMTYAGLKSFIFAGVSKEDKRVKAAVGWIKKNYTLDVNPGMPEPLKAAGLYYYYHTFAKALDALDEDSFTDEAGKKHDWRAEMIAELKERQQKNGSWINTENDKWLETDAALVTGYALLALSYCEKETSNSVKQK